MRDAIDAMITRGELEQARDALETFVASPSLACADIAWAHRKRAQCAFMRGEPDLALEEAQRAVTEAQRCGSIIEEAEAENALGIVQGERGDLADAVQHLERSYELHREAGSDRVAAVLNNVGHMFLTLDDVGRALHYFYRALEAARAGERQIQVEATALGNVGRALHVLARYDEAEDTLRRTVALFAEAGMEGLRAHAIAKLAQTVMARGDAAEAERLFRESLALVDAQALPPWVHELHGQFAALLVDQERYEEASPYLEQAIAALEASEEASDLPRMRMMRGAVLEHRGDTSGALAETRRAFEDQVRVAQRRTRHQLYQAMGRVELTRLEQETEHYRLRAEEMEALAARDPLTGLFNRRTFVRNLEAEIARARRHDHPLSLALIDLDFFKSVNDRYGHPVGDRVLVGAATLFGDLLRLSDSLARYGGEEFAIILPETASAEATIVANKLAQRLRTHRWQATGYDGTVTMSAGVTELHAGDTLADLIERADRLLYAAKRDGRDRVVHDTPAPSKS